MHGASSEALQSIEQDRERGSEALASEALEALATHLEEAPADDVGELRVSAETFARELAEARPAMRVLPSTIAAAWRRVNAAVSQTAPREDLRQDGAEAVRGLALEASDAREEAAATAHDVLGDARRVVTLSRSSTIREALDGLEAEVVVLASEPGGEGRTIAAELREDGVDARLAPDAQAAGVVEEADALLVGADGITRNGGVVNKVGTRTAAVAAREQDVPVWVACSTWKAAPGPLPDAEARWDPEAVPGVDVPLFETVPAELVSVLATERGPLQPREAADVACRRAKDMASLGLDLG
jgi:translation initiation factor 2B subunit (eIF-2B alpha/beta/delta family)